MPLRDADSAAAVAVAARIAAKLRSQVGNETGSASVSISDETFCAEYNESKYRTSIFFLYILVHNFQRPVN